MQEIKGLVSIIIPCYNAEEYIDATIESIKIQTYDNWEILLIDDGSTDSSRLLVQKHINAQIHYFYQANQGVSLARNKGLEKARGEFVVFFDADDLMSVDFLESRVKILENDLKCSFCASEVIFFPERTEERYIGAVEELPASLLLYKKGVLSCPSNYMLRKSVLEKFNIKFNSVLSSTADRYFLIELSRIAQGKLISEGKLYYRIVPNSMSHKISNHLINDNELFYKQLKRNNLIPSEISREAYFKMYYALGGGFFKIGQYFKAANFLLYALFTSPRKFIQRITR